MLSFLLRSALLYSLLLMQISTNIYSQTQKLSKPEFLIHAEKITLNNTLDTLACRAGNEIYFTHKQKDKQGKGTTDGHIWVYNLSTKKSSALDLLPNTEREQKPEGAIVKILYDAFLKRIYFSTIGEGVNTNQYLSWFYDITAHETSLFKEGVLSKVGTDGTIEILTTGSDYKGRYTVSIQYNSKGIGHITSARIYEVNH